MNRPRGATVATAGAVVLATAGGLLTAATPAFAAVTCTSPVFKRTFYANTTFSGGPRHTDCDSAIDQNWGTGAPYKGMPVNNFGVRWSTTRDFGSGGPFTFTASSRDGIRVYLDGVRKVDLWKNVSTTVGKAVNVTIPSGRHTLRIDFVNWTGSANVTFGYAPRTSATVDKVKPLVPAGPTVAYSATTASTKVSWAKNKEMDLAGYRVYRRLKGASFPSKPITTTASTSYTDTTVPKDGNVYYYEVRAYDKAGNTSSGTADLGITTVDRTAPAAPKGVEKNWAIGFPTTVTLYWDGNTEPDLAGYRVYRSTSSPVAPTPENRVTGDTLSGGGYRESLPQTGDDYYYVVTAVDTHGNESAPSGTAKFYSLDRTGPVDTALNARAVEDEAGVTLAWDASELTSGDSAGYSVYRSSKPRTAGAIRNRVGAGVRDTSFTDPAPRPGVKYYYWVVAEDYSGNQGTPSEDVVVTAAGNTSAPAAVTGLAAIPKENGVTLSWDASSAPGFDHYVMLRGTLTDGQWTYKPVLHPADQQPWEITTTTFHDAVPADGQQVRYSVVAVDQYGNQVTPETGATVTDVAELDLRPTAPPATGGPLSVGTDTNNSIHWYLTSDRNEDGSPVSGFAIHRWNRQTGTFDLIHTEPRGNTTGWSWWDWTQPDATTVYYRVTALYADGTESGAYEAVAVTD